ncbi:MAG: dihydropteroate synthase [Anaerolineales bacterium]|jgi:5-methyltetrahydrofolate--homocysteine methyltransferase
MTTILKGTGEPLVLDPQCPSRMIGERINPSGRKKLRQALLDQDWDYLVQEACDQVEAGADIIDVNVGGKGIDEETVLPHAVLKVAAAVDVPLSIDTRHPGALEAALAVCSGRPIVNSIGGETKILARNLPIVAEHGLPVIILCMGQEGIPPTPEERLRIAEQVTEKAVRAGVNEEDLIFDPLVMTVGADDQAAHVALETIRLLREAFPENSITGGASNVSYGMPSRSTLNAHFLAVACMMGMNVPITDPKDQALRLALLAADAFLGRDRKMRCFMRHYRASR